MNIFWNKKFFCNFFSFVAITLQFIYNTETINLLQSDYNGFLTKNSRFY